MNYTELVQVAVAYADRQDIEVENNIDNFIILTEARVNRLLKTREQSTRTYAPTVEDQEYYPLPPDYIGMRDIQLDDPAPTETSYKDYQFHYLNPEQFNLIRNTAYVDTLYYTVIANQIQIFPIQDGGKAIELIYYQRVPPMTAEDSTNWMGDNHPDIYVAGITAEISLFAKDYEAAEGWYARLKTAIGELEVTDVKERWAGQALVTRVG
jgi:hypothetical protein